MIELLKKSPLKMKFCATLTSNASSFRSGIFVRVTAFLNSSVGRCRSAVLLLLESFISDPQCG